MSNFGDDDSKGDSYSIFSNPILMLDTQPFLIRGRKEKKKIPSLIIQLNWMHDWFSSLLSFAMNTERLHFLSLFLIFYVTTKIDETKTIEK